MCRTSFNYMELLNFTHVHVWKRALSTESSLQVMKSSGLRLPVTGATSKLPGATPALFSSSGVPHSLLFHSRGTGCLWPPKYSKGSHLHLCSRQLPHLLCKLCLFYTMLPLQAVSFSPRSVYKVDRFCLYMHHTHSKWLARAGV